MGRKEISNSSLTLLEDDSDGQHHGDTDDDVTYIPMVEIIMDSIYCEIFISS